MKYLENKITNYKRFKNHTSGHHLPCEMKMI